MEKWILLLALGGLLMALMRLVMAPIRLAWKLAINGLIGFVGLWIVNFVLGFSGIGIPFNAVTVLIAGILGLPGIGLLAILEWWI